MPQIKLTDISGLDIEIDPDPASLFAKYVLDRNPIGISPEGTQNLSKTDKGGTRQIKDLESQSLQLSFTQEVPLGTSDRELSISPKAGGSISVAQGKALFDKELFEKVTLPGDQKYFSTCLKASLETNFTDKSGDLKFGFTAGSDCTLTSSQPVNDTDPLVPAIEAGFKSFLIPADLADIEAMPVLTVASVEGNGSIKLKAEIDAPITPYPLASLPTGISGIGISVSAPAKLGVQIAPSITGAYKLQVTKLDKDTVLLAYSRTRGATLEVTFMESVGISGTVADFDVIQQLLGAVIPDAKLPENDLKKLNLSEDETRAISTAIKGGIQKGLQLSLQEQLDESAGRGTAFLYQIKLSSLDDRGKAAVSTALDCDLTLIEGRTALSGITPIRSIVSKTRESSRALKLNLFAILNAGSFHDYIQKAEWITDGDTGDITLIDTLSASEVGYRIDNLAKDSQKLRHVIGDGAVTTCIYKASKTGYQPALTTSLWAFDLNQSGTASILRSYLDVALAMNLMDADTAKAQIAAVRVPLGRTIFNAEVKLDDALIDRLFFDETGRVRERDEYEKLGREAMLQTLPPDLDSDILGARQSALTNDQIWKQMADERSFPAVAAVLKAQFGNSPKFEIIASDIYGDYNSIDWWAGAMAGVAAPLEALRQFLKDQTITDPHNNTLSKLRGNLNKQLRSAISNAHDRFHEPWGLVAMDLASGQAGEAKFIISSPRFTTTLTRKAAPAPIAAGAASNI